MLGNIHDMVRLAEHAGQLADGLTATMHKALTVRVRRIGHDLSAAASVRWRGSRRLKFKDGTS
eukprot:14303567-Alexandrium_andersonii.AAC.1